MASIRTPEQIQQLLEERKRINQRKRELERKKYEKARELIKQALKEKKKKEEPVKQQSKLTYKVTVYNESLIERFTAEEDLYQSWEELKEAEDRGEGALNWDVLKRLIDKLRNNL